MGKPTIAMVNGVAAGAGLSIALAADMRFVGKSARMTTAFAKVGFSGDFGSHYFLHKLVGTSKARELYFTAEILNAEQIEKLGLANRVVDDANLESETMTFAKKLASGPRVAWWHVKKNMKVAEEGTLSEALDSEAARMIRTGETEDHKEAARAFAARVLKEGGPDDATRLNYAWRLALARHLNPLERAVLEKTLAQQRELFAAEKPSADLLLKVGDYKHPEAANPVELAAWTALANVLLNLNETISQ